MQSLDNRGTYKQIAQPGTLFDFNDAGRMSNTDFNINMALMPTILLQSLFRSPIHNDNVNRLILYNLWVAYTTIRIIDHENIIQNDQFIAYLTANGVPVRTDNNGVPVPADNHRLHSQYYMAYLINQAISNPRILYLDILKNINGYNRAVGDIHSTCELLIDNIFYDANISGGFYMGVYIGYNIPINLVFISPRQPDARQPDTRAYVSLATGGSDDYLFWLFACAVFNLGYRDVPGPDRRSLSLVTYDKQNYYDARQKTGIKNLASEMIGTLPITCLHITCHPSLARHTHSDTIIDYNSPIILNTLTDYMRYSAGISTPPFVYTDLTTDIMRLNRRHGTDNQNFRRGFDSANFCTGLDNLNFDTVQHFNDYVYLIRDGQCSRTFFEQFISYIKYIQNIYFPPCNGVAGFGVDRCALTNNIHANDPLHF